MLPAWENFLGPAVPIQVPKLFGGHPGCAHGTGLLRSPRLLLVRPQAEWAAFPLPNLQTPGTLCLVTSKEKLKDSAWVNDLEGEGDC